MPKPALDALAMVRTEPVILSEMILEAGRDPWKFVSSDNRQSVRKAEKRGVTVRDAKGLPDYEAFYRVYTRAFRDFGTPPYGRRYFPAVHRLLHDQRLVRLFMAEAEGRVVGGLLLFCWGGYYVSKFAAVLPDAVPLRAFAALYARAINCAVEEGARRLSWGTSSASQAGLIEFKERWGARSHPASVYCLPLRKVPPPLERYYDDSGLARRVWRRLPLGATVALGGLLNRWFC
jgi:lipid II:glycine glycyltransferase (peptidoglycan interpeptide bridge formation enzyme)